MVGTIGPQDIQPVKVIPCDTGYYFVSGSHVKHFEKSEQLAKSLVSYTSVNKRKEATTKMFEILRFHDPPSRALCKVISTSRAYWSQKCHFLKSFLRFP